MIYMVLSKKLSNKEFYIDFKKIFSIFVIMIVVLNLITNNTLAYTRTSSNDIFIWRNSNYALILKDGTIYRFSNNILEPLPFENNFDISSFSWNSIEDKILFIQGTHAVYEYNFVDIKLIINRTHVLNSTITQCGFLDVDWHPNGEYALVVGYENKINLRFSDGVIFKLTNAGIEKIYDGEVEYPPVHRLFHVRWSPSGDFANLYGSAGANGMHLIYYDQPTIEGQIKKQEGYTPYYIKIYWDENSNYLKVRKADAFQPMRIEGNGSVYYLKGEHPKIYDVSWNQNNSAFIIDNNNRTAYLIYYDTQMFHEVLSLNNYTFISISSNQYNGNTYIMASYFIFELLPDENLQDSLVPYHEERYDVILELKLNGDLSTVYEKQILDKTYNPYENSDIIDTLLIFGIFLIICMFGIAIIMLLSRKKGSQ